MEFCDTATHRETWRVTVPVPKQTKEIRRMMRQARGVTKNIGLPVALSLLIGCAGNTQQTPVPKLPSQTSSPAPAAPPAPVAAQPPEQPKKPIYDAVELIPREILIGNPTRAQPKLSPDGKRLAYIAPHEGVLNVWVRTVGQSDDKVVTSDKKRGIRVYFWALSGKRILYLQDKGGDENFHVYAVPAGGGEAVDLTPIDGIRAQIVAVERSRPNEILVGINDRNPQLHDVYKINIATGQRHLVQKNHINAVGWIADHTMRVRVAQVITPDGGIKLLHRSAGQKTWQEILVWEAEDLFTSGGLSFARDNRTLYIMSTAGSNATELRALDVWTKKQQIIASDRTADVREIVIHPTNYKIQAVGFTRARTEWKVLDPAIKDDFAALAKLHAGDFDVVNRDDADKTWLIAYTQDKGPIAYYAYDRAKKAGTFLFSHRPELENLPLAEMKPVSYKARDGLTIHGYLTTPVGVDAKNLPAVIFPHGGPWYRDEWRFHPLVQILANRGYAVLQPNFRGSTGYGKEFLNAANREWGGKMQDDITDGTKWLIEQGVADASRICIMGGSYGGYATLMGLAKEPDLYACGVDIVGVANLITWMKTIPPYWIPFRHVLYQRVGNPETEADFLKSRSPVFLADRIKAPLLIAQGANDPRVPKAESTQIRDALQKVGREVHYMEFADEGHGFARPENRLKFLAAAEKFLAAKIGGRYEE
ncbi:MAG: S9 family peptidase [Proteobacteria bacterium]|nr:S9 family peptidase [Pseudomonadota bacterium]